MVCSTIVIWLLLASLMGQVSTCPSGWITHGSNCYHFSHDTENWIGALQFCRELKSQLVEINDAQESTYLEAQAKLLNNHFWIGLSDAEEESTWMWMTSRTPLTPQSFTDWAPGQPDNYNSDENCGCLYIGAGFKWNDCTCHDYLHYICEKPDEATEIVG